jgi:ribosomal protein S18 acetylase RimI-like enzyme
LLDWLDFQCFPGDDLYSKRKCYWWIVYKGTKPIAFAGLKPYDNGEGFMCRVGVLPGHRGRGLQKQLLILREVKARELGLTDLFTYTLLVAASIKSLLSAGYEIYPPEHEYAGEEVLYFRKTLCEDTEK